MYCTVNNANAHCYTGGKPLAASTPTVASLSGVRTDTTV